MDRDITICAERVSKKYCKSLRRSMLYGLEDLSRNMLGIRSRGETLRADEFWAVDDVSFEVKRGESVGLIGPNGSGKTTLLKMLNGIFWPDRGRIRVRGRVGALIAVGAGFHPLLTGRENVYVNGAILGMTKAEVDKRFDAIVDFAGIGDFLDTPVKHYSSGMFVRLGFAVAVHAEPGVLLVDEVLAVGDRGFQTKCFQKMGELRKQGTTFLVVSHNMHTVAGFVDWVALLHNGKFKRYDDVFEGIRDYARCFREGEEEPVEELVREGKHIRFGSVKLSDRLIRPGGEFSFTLGYECSRDYEDAEIDVAVYAAHDPDLYFQATNHAYGRRIDLRPGAGTLRVTLKGLPIQSSLGRIVLAIWDKGRTEQLFWWRVPVEFDATSHSTGKNFLPVEFELE
jgi:lipopolysaccharide transport system ATP-binding protein